MKLACHRAMILTQFYWRPSQQVPWRAMCSNKWSCCLSLVQIKFSLTACSSVHTSLAHGPQLVSSLGRKVSQSRRRVSGIVGITKSGTEEEHRIRYEELGRYGIDVSDYADMMTQVSDEHQTSSSSKIKNQRGRPLMKWWIEQNMIQRTQRTWNSLTMRKWTAAIGVRTLYYPTISGRRIWVSQHILPGDLGSTMES